MILLRIGSLKEEKPAVIDKLGIFRDLSSVIKDLNAETINQNTLELINKTDLSKLPKLSKKLWFRYSKVITNCGKYRSN